MASRTLAAGPNSPACALVVKPAARALAHKRDVQLNVVQELEAHPIRQFFDRGLRCTISTDDPFSFGNTVEDEYAALSSGLQFSHQELAQIAKNGFEVAQLDAATRTKCIAEVDAVLADFEG